uniref:hypothetical protein n=1 Tax=Acinetobacter baumannii TaxID=470 RepID=UPI001C07515E
IWQKKGPSGPVDLVINLQWPYWVYEQAIFSELDIQFESSWWLSVDSGNENVTLLNFTTYVM